MNFSLTITGESQSELLEALGILKSDSLSTIVKVASKKETTKQEPEQKTNQETPAASSKEITIEQVREAVQQKTQGGKREAVKALLTKFEVGRVTDLQPTQYLDFLTQVQAL